MLTTNKLILSLIIVIILMTFLMLFKLPNYRIPGYITIITLFILTSMFILKSSINYKFSAIHILLVLIPLIFITIINVNKNFEKILDSKTVGDNKVNIIGSLNIMLLITQFGLLYNALNNLSTDYAYVCGIVSTLNLFVTGLLWREVAFYVTDG